ncbi:arginine-tRNA-protein transferase [Paecilomyces variotii No. 5]|uniref:arginyltransferase n=1 Tax=Byssochlamys spectabilis (strain No. 5 / NBRC 109023) TaxID=1356009 RepID=V5FXT4_BYSSN|nr:arginine-tRNA-protein transferase [Paecilomyces variotii No. 5]
MELVDAERARQLSLFRPLGASYYASSVSVRPEHYEELVNRGWRRSGTLYYKQNLQRSCCPHYTMRLDASEFKPRKDQRKALNRWNKYVLGPEYMRKAARLCPKTREEKKHRKCNFDLLTAIHESEYENVKRPIDPETKRPIEPAHKFEVTTEGDSISQRKFEVFLKYQKEIHKEDESRWKSADFKRFLCSGLKKETANKDGKEQKLGSWHQCYRLDGRLIAVAVLDLLPHGVSSVYIFYDPEFGNWEFGKLSALREIAFALENNYQYYYMGYYIHSCQKMRYKGTYRPQYILDPESYTWDPLDGELSKKLDERPYVSLSRDRKLASQKESNQDAEAPNQGKETEENDEEMSLFDLHMPGVLTVEEVQALDLDHWFLLVHGSFLEMTDLVNWETSDIRNPQSIKGIIAELAAVLGPNIVKNSAVVLFD